MLNTNLKEATMHLNIGKLIKQEMIRQCMKPQELADLVYVSTTNIYSIFKRKSIDTELLERFSQAMHTNFFAPMAQEVDEQVNGKEPTEALDEVNRLSCMVQGNDLKFFTEDELEEGFQEVKQLYISLLVNCTGYDEVIDLPQELFPLLSYAYDCAMEGPFKGKTGEEVYDLLFPWLEINHPKLANAIKESVAELLTEQIAEDLDGYYRYHINYKEPTSIDDWYSLGDNEIEYYIDDIHERIETVKRPLGWKPRRI